MATSPVGGTTSLPQYLQQRQQTGGAGQQMAGMLAQPAQPKPATTPTTSAPTASPTPKPAAGLSGASGAAQQAQPAQPGMWATGGTSGAVPIPAPPPVQQAPVAAPPVSIPAGSAGTPAPAGQPAAAKPPAPLSNLPAVIQQMLDHPGAYDNDTIGQMRESGMHNLEDLRRSEEDRLRTDASSRGVYRGSGLSTSLGDLSERYVRGAQDLESDLLEKSANSRQQGLMQAIQSAFGYGQGEMQNTQLQAYILNSMLQQGNQGGPTIPGSVDAFGQLGQPGVMDNSEIYKQLGQLAGGGKAA